MALHMTGRKVDFETRLYYAEQGLSLLNYYRCQHGKLLTHKAPVSPCGGSGYCNCWGCCEALGRRRHGGRIRDQEEGEYHLEESIKSGGLFSAVICLQGPRKTRQVCLPSKFIYNSRWEMEELQRKEKQLYPDEVRMGQNRNHGMLAWADPLTTWNRG